MSDVHAQLETKADVSVKKPPEEMSFVEGVKKGIGFLTSKFKDSVSKLLGWGNPHGNGHDGKGHGEHTTHEQKPQESNAPNKKPIDEKLEPRSIKGFDLFVDHFKPDIKNVLYPCCGADVINETFPKAHVTYVDKSESYMNTYKKAGYDAHYGSILDFKPAHDPDLLVLFNPQLKNEDVTKVAEFVKPGKYVLCNDYHHTAEYMYENPDFEFIGIIKKAAKTEDNKLISEDLEKYVKPKEAPTDNIIKPHRFKTASDDYYFFRRKTATGQALPKPA